MTGLRAIMVAVDYADLLAVTLPHNRHHFDEVHIVTDHRNFEQVRKIAVPYTCCIWPTDLFYFDGAKFNKWAALEWGLDQMGRHGWLCVMDADVLWPRGVSVAEYGQSLRFGLTDGRGDLILHRAELMSPLRRMAPWPITVANGESVTTTGVAGGGLIYAEQTWNRYPIHRNVAEWAGYTQVFHACDPHLPAPPWHQTDWVHAGGADSFFQARWPHSAKKRPPWEVLHLGEPGANWFGRATPYANGGVPADAAGKGELVREVWRGRADRRRRGLTGDDVFRPERLG